MSDLECVGGTVFALVEMSQGPAGGESEPAGPILRLNVDRVKDVKNSESLGLG